MKLSSNLIHEFLNFEGVKPEALAKKLTLHTAEIEGFETRGDIDKNVVIAEIKKIKPHQNAEKLQIAIIDDGEEEKEIVCGAPNIKVGQKVPFAKLGSILPGNFKIKKALIRGVESNGMLCSAKELGLAEDAKGILILPESSKTGEVLVEELKEIKDTIYEVDNKSLTHRADLFSHEGFAREVSAIFENAEFKERKLKEIPEGQEKLEVKIEAKKTCRRYTAVKISNICIKPSPFKIQMILSSCGIRPINNIVDVTNLVLLELGQPLHAFDARKVNDKLIIREAKNGGKTRTLDGEERKLKDGDILICDSEKAIALGGVMGGENTEISDDTTEIILESANFDPAQIRKTSSRLGLRTESSIRFEKDLDPNLALRGAKRAVELFLKLSPGAKVTSELVDIKNFESKKRIISFEEKEIERNLGIKIKKEKIIDILDNLGFKTKFLGAIIKVEVPSFRAGKDVSIAADVIEEIGRIYGYEKINPVSPERSMSPPMTNKIRSKTWEISTALSLNGFFEAKTYVFTGKNVQDKFGESLENFIEVRNPISQELTHLRKSLIPNLISLSTENIHDFDEFKIFEIGRVYLPNKDVLPDEREKLSGIFVKRKNKNTEIFTELKKDLDNFFKIIKTSSIIYSDSNWNFAHPGKVAKINDFGFLAELHPELKQKFFGNDFDVGIFELDLEKLIVQSFTEDKYESIPKFPSISRDISLVFPANTKYSEIEKNILSSSKKIRKLELFDIYKVSEKEKSFSFHLEFLDKEKTMTDEEGERVFQKILKNTANIGGEIRM